MSLEQYGWDSYFQHHFKPYGDQGLCPARIICEHRHAYLLYSEYGELLAEIAGRMRHTASGRNSLPAVGDWVAIQARPQESAATIHAVLPRKSRFSRKAAGDAIEEQIVAANIDTVFLVSGLDHDFNPRRIERYLAAAWDSGANPVIILNKADLCPDLEARIAEVESIAISVRIHAVSAAGNRGLDAVRKYLTTGRTVALLGSSGVGKSTLTNALLGLGRQATTPVHDHDGHSYGQHTTTHRELIPVPAGGLLIDTPGMRELTVWDNDQGLSETFEDIERLALQCRFSDCQHANEPGCAVQTALADGTLDAERYRNYLKLQKELRYLAGRQDEGIRNAERARWKKIAQLQKQIQKQKRKFR